MCSRFHLEKNTVYIWSALLSDFTKEMLSLSRLLRDDEVIRANHFHYLLHRQRYAIARGLLRKQLSIYTGIPAEEIQFAYGKYGKPYLTENPLDLHFNVSHSHGRAVYAFTLDADIGIDIERINSCFEEDIARRYFNVSEYESLCALSDIERTAAFYQIWSCKEALLKSTGDGLSIPLSEFYISLSHKKQIVSLNKQSYYVEHLSIDPLYASAFAIKNSLNPKVIVQKMAVSHSKCDID